MNAVEWPFTVTVPLTDKVPWTGVGEGMLGAGTHASGTSGARNTVIAVALSWFPARSTAKNVNTVFPADVLDTVPPEGPSVPEPV